MSKCQILDGTLQEAICLVCTSTYVSIEVFLLISSVLYFSSLQDQLKLVNHLVPRNVALDKLCLGKLPSVSTDTFIDTVMINCEIFIVSLRS